ncbi:MAG TPA: hypothetical protein VFN34_00750 [Ornithinibacter sp.]|nr:hypothetical protein [Ornithinibacter sp.]
MDSTLALDHDATPTTRAPVRGWLGWFAVALVVGMQAGTLFKPLGTVGETRVADWVDLLTPYVLLGCAAMVLARAGAARGPWILFGVGAVTFTLGHGLHLSANSVSNVTDAVVARASIVHLWDEVVSHWIWYTGLFLVLAALAWGLRGRTFRVGVPGVVLALLVALTLTNTYIEGGTPWLGVLFLAAAVVAGLLTRPDPVSRVLLLVGGAGVVLLVGWGVYWALADGSLFPQVSDLGWI